MNTDANAGLSDSAHGNTAMPLGIAPRCCLELDFSRKSASALAAPWGGAPGCVALLQPGALVLHYAPQRWLLIADENAHAEAARDSGAVVFDVTGKWRIRRLPCATGVEWLSAALCLPAILEGRGCAAVTLFDVPGVIAHLRSSDEYLICTHASYA